MKFTTLEEEYEKNKNIKPEDVKCLMDWVDSQLHLPKITELEAVIFLSCYSGSKELAKNLIDIYYTTRSNIPEFFKYRNPYILDDPLEIAVFQPLEIPEGYDETMIFKFLDHNISKFNFEQMLKVMGMVGDLWFLSHGSVSRYQILIDIKGAEMRHLIRINPITLKKVLFVFQETLPYNITFIHVINVQPIVDTLLSMAKPFMKSDLLQKIIYHNEGLDSLYKYVPQKCLPKNLGGNGPTYEELHVEMKDLLRSNAQYFAEEELFKRVDEKKREEKQKNASSIFGTEGSFKKLDLD